MSDVALASSATSIAKADTNGLVMYYLTLALSSSAAKGIATVAVFAVSTGLFLRKISWLIAASTITSVAITFSIPKFIAILGGNMIYATPIIN